MDTDPEADEGATQADGGGVDGGLMEEDDPPGVSRRDAGAAPDAATEGWGDGGTLGNCVLLIDQSTGQGQAANGGVIAATSVKAAMCQVVDANDKETSSIWSRKDGELLMEAGESYSFRWPASIMLVTAVRLFGGSEQCSADKIHEQAAMLPAVYLPSPGCAEIKSDFDVSYLRMAHLYGQWDLGAGFVVRMQLCKEPCPAQ